LDAHLVSLGEEARGEVLRAAGIHVADGPDGELDANECMFIGAKHKGDLNGLHPTGYRDDVRAQLDHAIIILEMTPSGRKGVFLFDNSTRHSKMRASALLAQGLLKGPGDKYVTAQRSTTLVDKNGTQHKQPFAFKQGRRAAD
jgi:hypothetical protein